MTNAWVKFITILLLVSQLSSCGFRLASQGVDAKALPPLKLVTSLPSIWQQRLYRFLQVREVDILQSSQLGLYINNFSESKRPVSLNSRAKVAEYRIEFGFDFYVITKNGKSLVPRKRLHTERIYRFNEAQVPGKQAEEDFLKIAMIDELYDQMLRYIDYAIRQEQEAIQQKVSQQKTPQAEQQHQDLSQK